MEERTAIEKFINKKLKSGYPAGELKNDLLAQGFTKTEIEALFLKASTKNQYAGKNTVKENMLADMFALAGVSFLIAGIAMIYIQTWLTEYGIWVIITGLICRGVKFFLSYQDKSSA